VGQGADHFLEYALHFRRMLRLAGEKFDSLRASGLA
jgi:hypothetical protein